jgi:hypothetical protein
LNGAGASSKRVAWHEKTTLKKPRCPDRTGRCERGHRPIGLRRSLALTAPRRIMPKNDSLLNSWFFAVFGGASELGEAEFARYEIEHGDHVSG